MTSPRRRLAYVLLCGVLLELLLAITYGRAAAQASRAGFAELHGHLAFSWACYAAAIVLVAAVVFALRRDSRLGRSTWAIIVASVIAGAAPSVRTFVLEDICLDSGGAVNRVTLHCEW